MRGSSAAAARTAAPVASVEPSSTTMISKAGAVLRAATIPSRSVRMFSASFRAGMTMLRSVIEPASVRATHRALDARPACQTRRPPAPKAARTPPPDPVPLRQRRGPADFCNRRLLENPADHVAQAERGVEPAGFEEFDGLGDDHRIVHHEG